MTAYAQDHADNPCGICGAGPKILCPHDEVDLLPGRWHGPMTWRPYEPSREAERAAEIARLIIAAPGEPACDCGNRLTYTARLRGDGVCQACRQEAP